jgi:hypothetical protein
LLSNDDEFSFVDDPVVLLREMGEGSASINDSVLGADPRFGGTGGTGLRFGASCGAGDGLGLLSLVISEGVVL